MGKVIYCNQVPDLVTGQVVVVDGKSTMTSADFFECIWKQLNFQDAQNRSWDAYLDGMRDLSWLKATSVSIIIRNFALFLSKEPNARSYFIPDFENVVVSFWENDAQSVFRDPKLVKSITLYCIA